MVPRAILVAAVALLCVPSAAAGSAASDAYDYLAASHHTPAPLAPTTLPAVFGSFADVPAKNTEKGSNYSLVFTHISGNRADATLYVIREGRRKLSSQKRRLRPLYRARKTKVRSKPALSFKRKKGSGVLLAWVEDGILYEVGTTTPKKVSSADLVSTANGLEHLLGKVSGELVDDTGVGISARGYLTDRHVLLDLSWDVRCLEPGETQPTLRVRNDATVMLALNADAFAFGPTAVPAFKPGPDEPQNWTVSASGTASVAGGQITTQAAGDSSALRCATSPLSFGLQPRR